MNISIFPASRSIALCLSLLSGQSMAQEVSVLFGVQPSSASASSEMTKDQSAQHLIDGSGMDEENRHDRAPGAITMWHSTAKPAPTVPAPGIPAAPAWLRFDFATPQGIDEVAIWNHNQENLQTRGFRKLRVFGSSDGANWIPITDAQELAQGGDAAQRIRVKAPQPLKAVILAAESNWGDNYYGLSEVRFLRHRSFAKDAVPAPAAIKIAGFPFSWDAKEQLHRQVELDLGDTPLYDAADATVTCDGATSTAHIDFSPLGRRKLVLSLPAGKADARSAAAKVAVTLQSKRWKLQTEGAIEPPKEWPQLEEVVVVVKTHFDIGYTHRVKEVVNYYRTTMIDRALASMDKAKSLPPDQQFAWTGPGWVMSKVLEDWPGQTPERRKRLDEYVKTGKLRFHAAPFSLESDACEPEEMARGFMFSDQLSRKYNLPLSRAAKMTDVPSHGGALATVLSHGGVKFMHVGCNWPAAYVKTPGLFWWEGPDKSRVLTFYSSIYGTATGFNWSDEMGGGEPFVGRHFLPPAEWPYKVWPAIMVTMDNTGPPTAESIKAYFDEARKRLPGVKIRMGVMEDVAEKILATNPDLPVIKGEMPDTWIHGVASDPGGSKISRAVHPLISSAEVLRSQLGLWGVTLPDISKPIATAYENILLYGEHTWGNAPSASIYGEKFKKLTNDGLIKTLQDSWEDKTNYIREAEKIARGIDSENLKALADSVKAPAGSSIVYNPLPYPRSGIVEIDGKQALAKDIPASGYKAVQLSPASTKPSSETTLENDRYKITFDSAIGSISSLIDKHTGREWVDKGAERGLGQYLNERFTYEQTVDYTRRIQGTRKNPGRLHGGMHKNGMISEKEVPYRAAASTKGSLAITADTLSQTAIISCPADPANHLPATTLRVTLPKDLPYIDLELTIQDKAKDNWPEADWFCLPFKVANPQFRVYRKLGTMNPATDILDGANRDLFTTGNGVTISDADGAGIAICPLDHPLISLDRPGCWKFSRTAEEFTPRKPVVYVNLYNNQWNTNFRYWYPGTWSSRVRLWTFDAKTPADEVMATPALEARNPLQTITAASGSSGVLPAEQTGISLSRKGVIVTAFGATTDGSPGTLLRLWEQAGISGELTVSLPQGAKFTTATPVNLRGEKSGEPISIQNNKFSLPLGGDAPASFVLK